MGLTLKEGLNPVEKNKKKFHAEFTARFLLFASQIVARRPFYAMRGKILLPFYAIWKLMLNQRDQKRRR